MQGVHVLWSRPIIHGAITVNKFLGRNKKEAAGRRHLHGNEQRDGGLARVRSRASSQCNGPVPGGGEAMSEERQTVPFAGHLFPWRYSVLEFNLSGHCCHLRNFPSALPFHSPPPSTSTPLPRTGTHTHKHLSPTPPHHKPRETLYNASVTQTQRCLTTYITKTNRRSILGPLSPCLHLHEPDNGRLVIQHCHYNLA